MTNQTACMDGYSHAWEDSCTKDGKMCVALFKDYGFLPDASVVRKINGTWYRCGVERIDCGSTMLVLMLVQATLCSITALLQTKR